jgi:hypothetical protein
MEPAFVAKARLIDGKKHEDRTPVCNLETAVGAMVIQRRCCGGKIKEHHADGTISVHALEGTL